MESWISILLPVALVLARTSGFLALAPVFSWTVIPLRIRAAFCLLMTIFFAATAPVYVAAGPVPWISATLMLVRETLFGLAMGLSARMVYLCVQQGGMISGRQMGMMMAKSIDPTTGERSQPIGVLFDLSFLLLFIAAGGHHLLLTVLARSYDAFPAGQTPNMDAMVQCVVSAGSAMLLFALKLAAPVLAAFLVLGVMLAVLARVLPEMNLLMASLPLRVALGFIMAAAMMPMLDTFTTTVADWIKRSMSF